MELTKSQIEKLTRLAELMDSPKEESSYLERFDTAEDLINEACCNDDDPKNVEEQLNELINKVNINVFFMKTGDVREQLDSLYYLYTEIEEEGRELYNEYRAEANRIDEKLYQLSKIVDHLYNAPTLDADEIKEIIKETVDKWPKKPTNTIEDTYEIAIKSVDTTDNSRAGSSNNNINTEE